MFLGGGGGDGDGAKPNIEGNVAATCTRVLTVREMQVIWNRRTRVT